MCMRFRADSKRGRMQDFPLSQNGEPPRDTVNSFQPGWERRRRKNNSLEHGLAITT